MGSKKLVAQGHEKQVLKIITGLRRSKRSRATMAELKKRTGLELREIRQILRRLRRQKRVEVALENGRGKKQVRVYR